MSTSVEIVKEVNNYARYICLLHSYELTDIILVEHLSTTIMNLYLSKYISIYLMYKAPKLKESNCLYWNEKGPNRELMQDFHALSSSHLVGK